MMKILRSIKLDKRGASAAEYALILAVMGGFIVAATVLFGTSIQTAMTGSSTQLNTAKDKSAPAT